MASSRMLLLVIFILLCSSTIAQSEKLDQICYDNGNFTSKSTYQMNLDHLLSTLSKTQVDSGFYNVSYGQNPDTINAIALCRGDVDLDRCRSCISNATQELPQVCPNQKEAVVWYDYCMLRYANRYIFGKMESKPYVWMYNYINNVSDVNQFNQVVKTLLDGLKTRAASGGSSSKFATGNATYSNAGTVYALAQCTPDLSEADCNNCLTEANNLLPQCCSGRQGGRVITPSCNFRYEIGPFYSISVPPSAPSLSPASPPVNPVDVPPPNPASPPKPASTAAKGKMSSRVQVLVTIVSLLTLQYSISTSF